MSKKHKLIWTNESVNISQQEIVRKIDDGEPQTIATISGDDRQFTDPENINYTQKVEYSVVSVGTIKGIEQRQSSAPAIYEVPALDVTPMHIRLNRSGIGIMTLDKNIVIETNTGIVQKTVLQEIDDYEYTQYTIDFEDDGPHDIYISTTTNEPIRALAIGNVFTVIDWYSPGYSSVTIPMEGEFSTIPGFNIGGYLEDVPTYLHPSIDNMDYWFYTSTNIPEVITQWDTSNIKSMSSTFQYASNFNLDISSWDVSNVVVMDSAFMSATSFNQDIGGWDVSKVESVVNMFNAATTFNQDISGWDVSNVKYFTYMFNQARAFNADISGWNVSNALSIKGMLSDTWEFNQDISNWDVRNVKDFSWCFYGAKAFNQDISGWNVASAENMDYMFADATVFDQDLSQWCVAKITQPPLTFSLTLPTIKRPVWGTCPRGENIDNESVTPMVVRTVEPAWMVSTKPLRIESVDQPGVYLEPEENPEVSLPSGQSVSYLILNEGTYNVLPENDGEAFEGLFMTGGYSSIDQWYSGGYQEVFLESALNFFLYIANTLIESVPDHLHPSITNTSFFFLSAHNFNDPNVLSWDMSKVEAMVGMFAYCPAFNQDLSGWCVPLITEEPSMFALDSALAPEHYPVWGTCPNG